MADDKKENALASAQMFFEELNCKLQSSAAPSTQQRDTFSSTAPSTQRSGEHSEAELASREICPNLDQGSQHVLKIAVTFGETKTVGNLIVQDIMKCAPGIAEDEKSSGEEKKADKESDQMGSFSQAEKPVSVTSQLHENGEKNGTSESSGQSSGCGSVHSKMHLCRLCGFVLDSSQDLMEHVQQHLNRGDSCTMACHVCSRSFSSSGLLVQHLQAHSVMELVTSSAASKAQIGQEVKCTECGQKFSTALLLYQHLLTQHAASRKLHCPLCSATFSGNRQDKFLDHLMTHVAKPEVRCPVCEKKFVSQARLDSHMKIHGPRDKKHLCDLCGKPFFHKFYYQKHMKKQHGIENALQDRSLQASQHDAAPKTSAPNGKAQREAKFSCQICGKAFRNKGFMIRHMKAHAEHGPVLEHLRCGICNAVFTSEQEKRQHVKQHTFKYDCDLCSEKFTLRKLLMKHWRTDHPDYRPFKCGKCDKMYKHDYDRFRHEMSHEGKRPYQCPQCPRQLWNRSNLKQHILIHHSNIERKKEFPCQVCGKRFYTKHAVNNHKRLAHFSQREYECLFCHKKFKTRQALNTHNTIHTGEEPYKCKHCDKYFRSHSHVRQHIISEHDSGHRIWKCQDCESDFRVKKLLAAHVRTVHWQCFQCVERFPSRNASVKHRCNQVGEELYLKHRGAQVQVPPLTVVVGTSDEVVTTKDNEQSDASCSEVIAATSAERGSVEQNAQVPYTLTVSQDGRPVIKMPAYSFRKRGVRRNFPKLVPESNGGNAARGTEGVEKPSTVAQEEDIHTQQLALSVMMHRSAVVCEALPNTVSLSNQITSSPSKLVGDKDSDFSPSKFVNLCNMRVPSSSIVSSGEHTGVSGDVFSNLSKTVSTTPLVVADFPGAQDHDYNNTVSLGVAESLPEDIAQTILEQGISLTENTTVIVLDEQESSGNAVAGTVYPPQHANLDNIPLGSFFACLNEDESVAGTVDTETVTKSKTNADVGNAGNTRKRSRSPSSKFGAMKEVPKCAKTPKTSAAGGLDTDPTRSAEWAEEPRSDSLFGASSVECSVKNNKFRTMGKGVFIKVGEGEFCSVYTEDDRKSDSDEEKEWESGKFSEKAANEHRTARSRRSFVRKHKNQGKQKDRGRQDYLRVTSAEDTTVMQDSGGGIISPKEPCSFSGLEGSFEVGVYMHNNGDCDFEDNWNDDSTDENGCNDNTQLQAKDACTDTSLDDKVRIKISHGSGEEDLSEQEESYQDHASQEGEHRGTDVNQFHPILPSSGGQSQGKWTTKWVSDQGKGERRGAEQVQDYKSESATQQSQRLPVVKQPLTLQLMKKGNHFAPLQPQEHLSTQTQHPRKIKPCIGPAIQIVRRNFRCGFCDKIISTQELLQDHLLKVHKYEEFYQCQHCFVNTPTFSLLTAHFEQHAKELSVTSSSLAERNGGVLNRTQQVGPLWEATFISKERQYSVFVSV